jgi:sulfur carrier protein
MKIQVNGDWRDVSSATLQAVLAELGHGKRIVGTALNGQVVPTRERATTPLTEGDRLEILVPMQGG